MTPFEAIILGIIQGVTEFLPISSSGHLELGQYWLGLTEMHQFILFNLMCHLGTLCAIVFFFFSRIRDVDRKTCLQVVVGTLPLFPLVLIMKPIKAIYGQPQYLGYCFLVTAGLLYASDRWIFFKREKHSWKEAAWVGIFQAVAILPGISRSGATISAGKFLGWPASQAVTFSFLLAIPAILGGIFIEMLQLFTQYDYEAGNVGIVQYFLGFVVSLIIGYYALKWMMKFAEKNHFGIFVWYCLFLGIASILYFNVYE